jgi:uncharacterized membrane protein HdeD (DUF308 family)
MQAVNAMVRDLTDHWWIWLVRGIVAIILAVLAFAQPGATLEALTILVGAYFVVDGVLSIFDGLGHQPEGRSRWPLLIWGVISIVAGVSIFARPLFVSMLALTLVVGVWAIVIGIITIVTGIRLREAIDSEWWLILGGIATVIFGVLVWVNPLAGALSIAYLIGIWALLVGVLDIILGFRIRGLRDRVAAQAGA